MKYTLVLSACLLVGSAQAKSESPNIHVAKAAGYTALTLMNGYAFYKHFCMAWQYDMTGADACGHGLKDRIIQHIKDTYTLGLLACVSVYTIKKAYKHGKKWHKGYDSKGKLTHENS